MFFKDLFSPLYMKMSRTTQSPVCFAMEAIAVILDIQHSSLVAFLILFSYTKSTKLFLIFKQKVK